MVTIDLNCDMGEGMPYDADIMPYISSVNIACGYHAGNTETMKRTVDLALQYNVAIGAHPGFADRENFGRKEIIMPAEEYYTLIIEQLNLLKKITDAYDVNIHHVKPHGALYNMAAANESLARIIAEAVCDFDNTLVVYGLSGSFFISEATAFRLRTANEVFADRTYLDDGSLTPRSQQNALIEEETISIQQVLQMARQKTVRSIHNTIVPISAETICIHGDGAHAVQFAKRIREALKENGIAIKTI